MSAVAYRCPIVVGLNTDDPTKLVVSGLFLGDVPVEVMQTMEKRNALLETTALVDQTVRSLFLALLTPTRAAQTEPVYVYVEGSSDAMRNISALREVLISAQESKKASKDGLSVEVIALEQFETDFKATLDGALTLFKRSLDDGRSH